MLQQRGIFQLTLMMMVHVYGLQRRAGSEQLQFLAMERATPVAAIERSLEQVLGIA